jgi:hypothetical protein
MKLVRKVRISPQREIDKSCWPRSGIYIRHSFWNRLFDDVDTIEFTISDDLEEQVE